MSKPKAYAYIRFSTPDQASGDSLRRQAELARQYAEANGLDLDESPRVDRGVSGFKGANLRPDAALGQFLQEVDAGEIPSGSYLLVESLDRISRAGIHPALNLFMKILGKGLVLVTMNDGRRYDGANVDFMDMMTSLLVMQRAHEESDTKSRRLKAVWEKKRSNLKTEKATAVCPGWLQLAESGKQFEVVPHRAKVVQRIFQMCIDGYGSHSISSTLNSEGIPTFGRSSVWHNSYVEKTLTNRAVLGEFQPKIKEGRTRKPYGLPILDYFPKIIDDASFYAAQDARAQRKITGSGRKTRGRSNLFSGLLKCGRCGGTMRYEDKRGQKSTQKSIFLVCINAKNGRKCSYLPVRYHGFEENFLTYCRDIDFTGILDPEQEQEAVNVLLKEKTEVAAKKRSTSRQISNIVTAIKEGTESRSLTRELNRLESNLESLNAEEIRIQQDIIQHTKQKRSWENHRKQVAKLIDSMGDDGTSSTVEIKVKLSQLIKSIVKRITILPKYNDPAELSVLTSIYQESVKRGLTHFQAGEVCRLFIKKSGPNPQTCYSIEFLNGKKTYVSFDQDESTGVTIYDLNRSEQEWLREALPEPNSENISWSIMEVLAQESEIGAETCERVIDLLSKIKTSADGVGKQQFPFIAAIPGGLHILHSVIAF